MALALYAHATGLCKEVWRPVVRRVDVPGLIPHLFDFKGHGSRGLTEPITSADGTWDNFAVDDVIAAVDQAQQRAAHGLGPGKLPRMTPLPVIGVGHSFGAAALVKVSAFDGHHDWVLCAEVSPRSRWVRWRLSTHPPSHPPTTIPART
jgi:predicted alpha/beta hydrolase